MSAKKNKAGTTKVISNITSVPFENLEIETPNHTDEGQEEEEEVKSNEDLSNPTDDIVPDEIELEIIDLEDQKEQAPSLLIVDTPGWGDVEADNRELCDINMFR